MKFAFFPSSCLPFHAHTLEERPLGGIETAVIRLAEALFHLGQEVTVFSDFVNPPLSAPLYVPLKSIGLHGPVDVLVAVREWKPILYPLKARLKLFWTGDSFDQIQNVGLGDRRVSSGIDVLCAVSEWHRKTLCKASGFPESKSWILRNGVKLDLFTGSETRRRKRLIYTSTPYRGLKYLPAIYLEIKKRHPDAELHVFSGYDVYSGPSGFDQRAVLEFQALKTQLETLPDCYVRGNLKQRELAREFMKASVLAYPNTFTETSCITAMEAQAGGCTIVTSNRGALPETVGDAGILIDGDPESSSYQRAFIDAIDGIFSDDSIFSRLSTQGIRRAVNFDWKTSAETLLAKIA